MKANAIEFKELGPSDRGVLEAVAPGVFDDPVNAAAAAQFLNDPRHHLVVAIDRGTVIGFVSALHYLHPDKAHPELWINELGVADTHRGRGIGGTLIRLVLELAGRLGCSEAWVLTESDNEVAVRLYASVGGVEQSRDSVMFAFRLESTRQSGMNAMEP